MSNRNNPRRGDKHRTEHGPRSYGSATHVAKGRRRWRSIIRKRVRRLFNLGKDIKEYTISYRRK